MRQFTQWPITLRGLAMLVLVGLLSACQPESDPSLEQQGDETTSDQQQNDTGDAGDTDTGTTDPGTTDPGTTDPGTTDPGTTDSGTTDSGTTDSGTTDSGTTDPGTTDPGTSDPGTSEDSQISTEPLTLRGRVLDTAGQAMASVQVSAGGVTGQSDTFGNFELREVPYPTAGDMLVDFARDGYAPSQRKLKVQGGLGYAVKATLMKYQLRQIIDPTAGDQTLSAADPDNANAPLAEITFPDGALPSDSLITVSMAVADPTTDMGMAVYPGDFLATQASGQAADTLLESIAFSEITLQDANGAEITQLAQPATVKLRLPTPYQAQYQAGDTIPWWSYDEVNGVWVREDADPATTQIDDVQIIVGADSQLYGVAKVTHFSWWNIDKPITENGCMCVETADDDGNPVPWVNVYARGNSYRGNSNTDLSNANGRACVTVKRTKDSNQPETVDMVADVGGTLFHYDVTDSLEGDVTTDVSHTPVEKGSTLDGSYLENPAVCLFLKNKLRVHRHGGTVQGQVQNSIGAPRAGVTIASSLGHSVISDASGQYSMELPLHKEVEVFVAGLASQSVTLTDPHTPKELNFILPNRAPQLSAVSRDTQGFVANDGALGLSVSAVEPDGDPMSLYWSVSAGSLNVAADGLSATYTAPASGGGTALLEVRASDDQGAEARVTHSIAYGGDLDGTHFKITVLSSRNNPLPVNNIMVALYDTDNRTIASYLPTDAQGVSDFGAIDRERASFTIAYGQGDTDRIYTYVDIPVGQFVYYLDEFRAAAGAQPVVQLGCVSPEAVVNVTLDNLPGDAFDTVLQPMAKSATDGVHSSISVCDYHLQQDGSYSYSLLAGALDADYNITRYGFLLDQTPSNDNYNIALDYESDAMTWLTHPATNLNRTRLYAVRKGIDFTLQNAFSIPFGESRVPSDFPADYFEMRSESYVSQSGLVTQKRFRETPDSLVIPMMSDNAVTDVAYDDTSKLVSWSSSGTDDTDMQWISIKHNRLVDGTNRYTKWNVWLPADVTEFTLPDLPTLPASWVDMTAPGGGGNNLIVIQEDYDFVSSSDALWLFLVQGGDFDDTLSYRRLNWGSWLPSGLLQR